ncbi:SRPBCC family protein [Desertivirga brevis]|uniref:SRPBCC family protein n=1 Tax=Desertivirga brevis TaxID=2810310 RepID=UPI001A95B77A|nr:SRPBCC family protein [Pedobacter sp. SYSU D00873]
METLNNSSITVQAQVNAPIEKVWETWNSPQDITQWCYASEDWHAPYAENDLREGGKFRTTMAAKDGSFSFDFGGEYTSVQENKLIEYVMEDGRKVRIEFTDQAGTTQVVETFDPETTNTVEMQKAGWQAILDSFKKYTEAK